MRIVGFGDLYLDYYLKNDILMGINGGKTSANIIANLSKNYETLYLGVTGNDIQGNIAIDSLKKLNIDVSNIRILDDYTKCFFIDGKKTARTCPYCDRKRGYSDYKITLNDVLPFIKEDDKLIFDAINDFNIELLNRIENDAFLDLGYVSDDMLIRGYDELGDILYKKFKIINMNERVYSFFKEKFGVDSLDLYDKFSPDILIITRGKRGADIIFDNNFVKKEIEHPAVEVEVSGAGDAFMAEFIKGYLSSSIVDEKMISQTYIKAQSKASIVVGLLGARAHLEPNYQIESYSECICQNIKIKKN